MKSDDGKNDEGQVMVVSCWPPEDEEESQEEHTEKGICKDKDNEVEIPVKRQRISIPYDIDMADVALVKWWKKQKKRECLNNPSKSYRNAHAQLWKIVQSLEGQQFLKSRVEELKPLLNTYKQDSSLCSAIGSCYERLGQFDKAAQYMRQAVESDPTNKDNMWFLERIRRCQCIKQQQLQQNIDKSVHVLKCNDGLPPTSQVERRDASDFSVQDFINNYAMTSTPVIITGLTKHITSHPWTLQHIKSLEGERAVTVKKLQKDSVEWARLENDHDTTLTDYIDNLPKQKDKPVENQRYLFDWSLPQFAPKLAQELTIPKYFAGDLLQGTNAGSLYRDTWPSLFIAPAGLRSELHVDTFGSNFWMALLQGKKRWVFFPKEDLPYLYPTYPHSMDPVFEVNLADPDYERHPLLACTKPLECVLEEGEVLFVPSGCPHRVENLEESIAISANFVDPSNLTAVLRELTINGLVDSRAEELREQLIKKCHHLIKDEEIIKNEMTENSHPKTLGFKNRLLVWMQDIEDRGHLKWTEFKKCEQ